MKCRLLAAGTRLPEWVNTGFREYQKRLRAPLLLELEEIPVATRRAGENPERAVAREGQAMLAGISSKDYVVALEVAGASMSTEKLSAWFADRLAHRRRNLALAETEYRAALERDPQEPANGRFIVDDHHFRLARLGIHSWGTTSCD